MRESPRLGCTVGDIQMNSQHENLPEEITRAETFDLALLANFVHQVVNPLNGIAGTLDNLVEGVIKDEGRKL